MVVRKTIWVLLTVIFVTGNLARAQRNYTYTETVGEGYDHETIQAAIDAMNEHGLGPDALGCIEVYPGTYEHHAGSATNPDTVDETKWLPQYCDLIGMGQAREDVEIEMDSDCTGSLHYNHYIIIGAGNNQVYHLKLYTDMGTKNGICLQQDSALNDCIVETIHISVYGREDNLVVTDCEIKSKFGPCITADKTFTISDCDLYPRARSWGMEFPAGIRVRGSGEIRRVEITASCASSSPVNGNGLYGIQLELATDEEVLISDVTIDLELTSLYKLYTFPYDPSRPPEDPHTLHVCGILSGKTKHQLASVPDNSYPGRAVVQDCTIDVTGSEEEDLEGDEDGADIMVDGVCIRGGGTVDVYGCSSITTSRDETGAEDEGYEYLLNEENGSLGASFPSIQFDPTGDEYYNPSKGDIEALWGIGFRVEDASGDAMAVFDYCGNLLLYGSLWDGQTWPSATTDDEFIVQDSANNLAVINAVDGYMFIAGLVKLDSNNDWVDSDTGEDEFIIHDKDGKPVAYIDESGNVYLKGGLFEEFELIEW